MMRTLVIASAMLSLAACNGSQDIDPNSQYGATPVLPDPSEQLIADVGVYPVVGWQAGETPTVPDGFRIEAIATGLSNPRNVLGLPNGDVLIVESKKEGASRFSGPRTRYATGSCREPMGRRRAARRRGRAIASPCSGTATRMASPTGSRCCRSPERAVRRGAGR